MLELHHTETDTRETVSLIQQWAERHGAKVETRLLLDVTQDDIGYETGMYAAQGDADDYLADKETRARRTPKTVLYTLDPATAEARREMRLIGFVLWGGDKATSSVAELKQIGYSYDDARMAEYLATQRRLHEIFTAETEAYAD